MKRELIRRNGDLRAAHRKVISAPFGPFKGVLDTGNPSEIPPGAMRECEYFMMTGMNKLSVRPGMVTALQLYDGPGNPVSNVLAVGTFSDFGYAIAYSAGTQDVYLYLFSPDMQSFYLSDGTLVPNIYVPGSGSGYPGPLPIARVWTAISAAPDVSVTEGLGYLYIANTVASDANGLYWPTVYWDGTYAPEDPLPNLLGSGTYDSNGNFVAGSDIVYFNGVTSFQQTLWGWGYGSGSDVADAYRPEMARFMQPNFGGLAIEDSVTIGNRVRSSRERIIGAAVAGQSLFLGSDQLVTRVTGYGRDSWLLSSVDQSLGFVGPKRMAVVGTYCYYWSPIGPMRIEGVNPYSVPEPLFQSVEGTVQTVVNAATMVCIPDQDRKQIIWVYDTGSGVRTSGGTRLRAADLARPQRRHRRGRAGRWHDPSPLWLDGYQSCGAGRTANHTDHDEHYRKWGNGRMVHTRQLLPDRSLGAGERGRVDGRDTAAGRLQHLHVHWAGRERRLRVACAVVLQRHVHHVPRPEREHDLHDIAAGYDAESAKQSERHGPRERLPRDQRYPQSPDFVDADGAAGRGRGQRLDTSGWDRRKREPDLQHGGYDRVTSNVRRALHYIEWTDPHPAAECLEWLRE